MSFAKASPHEVAKSAASADFRKGTQLRSKAQREWISTFSYQEARRRSPCSPIRSQ